MTKININFKKLIKYTILNDNKLKKLYSHCFPHSKYSIDNILDGILFILKTGISWRDSPSIVKWSSLYFHYCRFVSNNIFKKMYIRLRSKYMSNHKSNIQIIDSTFILNKFGKNHIARNKFFKNKNCNKVSLITDINGIPLSVLINTGNVHDLSFIQKHMKDLLLLNKKYNKKDIILLADKSYESKKVRKNIKNKRYILMIPKKKNMKIDYPFNKKLYKKRLVIEHTFQKLKIFRRIITRYDSKIKNYVGFLYLAISQIIYKNIN